MVVRLLVCLALATVFVGCRPTTSPTEILPIAVPSTTAVPPAIAAVPSPSVGFKEYSDCILGTWVAIEGVMRDEHGFKVVWTELDYAEQEKGTSIPDAIRETRMMFIFTACAPAKPERAFGATDCVGRAIDYFLQRHLWGVPGRGLNHGNYIDSLAGLFGLTVCEPALVAVRDTR